MSRLRNEGIRDRARAQVDRLVGPVRSEMLRGTAHRAAELTRRGVGEARAVQAMHQAGIIGLRPGEAAAELRAISTYGQLGAPLLIAAQKHGERIGLIDELGSLSFAELNLRSDHLAAALSRRGITDADCVGILCRNHRGFLDITFAAAKLGARVIYLNTGFSGPQIREVCTRERVSLLALDEEYLEPVGDLDLPRGQVVAWHGLGRESADTLEDLIRVGGDLPRVPPPRQHTKVVLLTSGTTGAPKGAPRTATRSLAPLGSMLARVPFHSGEATYIAPPMFHALGYSQLLVALTLGCTIITERHFVAERVLAAVTAHRPSALVIVPVMLRRMLGVLDEGLNHYDLSSLRIVFVSGAALEPELVRRAQRSLGPVLYNLYGSTEVAYATFATPADLNAAPGSAGYPPPGTSVRLHDGAGRPVVGPNRVGRIFVGNSFAFDGYTGGGDKVVIDGLMATGDLGHFDGQGRLWVDGREDEMIVSGGENLFPGEVEGLLATHPAIDEAAAIGVPDEEYGERLAAYVVLAPGQQLNADQVRAYVKANLARFKVPRDVIFVPELPRTATGKVLKRDLRRRHAAVDSEN